MELYKHEEYYKVSRIMYGSSQNSWWWTSRGGI